MYLYLSHGWHRWDSGTGGVFLTLLREANEYPDDSSVNGQDANDRHVHDKPGHDLAFKVRH